MSISHSDLLNKDEESVLLSLIMFCESEHSVEETDDFINKFIENNVVSSEIYSYLLSNRCKLFNNIVRTDIKNE